MDHLPLTRETIPNDLLNLCAFLQRCVGSPSFSAVGCNRGMYYDPGMGEPKFTMRVGSFGTLALRGSFFRTQAMLHDYQVRRQIDMPEVWSITSGRSILILEEIFQASGPLSNLSPETKPPSQNKRRPGRPSTQKCQRSARTLQDQRPYTAR